MLYKRDSKGQKRIWTMEQDGGKHRTIAGLLNGQRVVSEWTVCEPKNVGRSNETSAEQQATLEIEAAYKKKLKEGYTYNESEVDEVALFKPMLAHKYDGWTGPCYSQPKLDGIRCIATKNGLYSRTGEKIVAVPHILADLQRMNSDWILDGELYNHDLKNDFNTITSLVRKQNPTDNELRASANLIQYHIYDMFSHSTYAVRATDLKQSGIESDVLCIVPTVWCGTEAALDHQYGQYLITGYEGQMVRAINGLYENKRSKNLLKRKEFKDSEFLIVDIEEGLGNWSGVAKRITCSLPDGRTFGAGLKGDKAHALSILQRRDDLIGKMVTVRYFTETPDGIPRFPVAYDFDRRH